MAQTNSKPGSESSGQSADSTKLRLGVVGTGSVVREIYQHLYFNSEYANDVDVVAACDVDEAVVGEFCKAHGLPEDAGYTDYRKMIEDCDLDAVAVNTPDTLHKDPVVSALDAGLDVIVPKPTAGTVADVHAMMERMRSTGRFIGVDFHKREDPAVKETRARYRRGEYGSLQSAVLHMVDRLMVADPNYEPRFFSSEDFAERNSPVTFLTSHMSDTFIHITGLRPVCVEAVGYKQKLPSLAPISVNGYDLVDTTVDFENGARCHIISGWALPNTASCITMQSGRLVFSDALVDLWQESYSYHEVSADGIHDRNILFLNFEDEGVSGYGIRCPGEILRRIRDFRAGAMTDEKRKDLASPFALGFYTTLVCECAQVSLDGGETADNGVVRGRKVPCRKHVAGVIGAEAAAAYFQ